jgi:P27 family predicted phage terminase small subunit
MRLQTTEESDNPVIRQGRGRKPQPKTTNELVGIRNDKVNQLAPLRIAEKPEPPEHLDPVAAEEFRRIVGVLDSLEVLSKTDADAVALYASLYSQWVEAKAALRVEGAVYTTSAGVMRESPWATICNRCVVQMAKLLDTFGMTPKARTRVQVLGGKPKQIDALDDFLVG